MALIAALTHTSTNLNVGKRTSSAIHRVVLEQKNMHRFVRGRLAAALAVGALCLPLALSGAPQASAQTPASVNSINHLVVIYQENWSFDSLYGKFPGANGIANAGAAANQIDKDGKPITVMPQAWDTNAKPAAFDNRFPANMPVGPYDIAKYMKPSDKMGDIVHRYYTEQQQIDGGKMDKFIAWSDNPGEVMGYFDATNMPEGKIAQQYVLADNFFHAAVGGSFLNHQFLICACAPTFANAPTALVAKLDANGVPTADNQPGKSSSGDGAVTPDGFGVNTLQPINNPHATVADPAVLLPLQTAPTIGDRLSEKNVSWAWYSGGWNDATAGKPDALFQFHHQPFNFEQRIEVVQDRIRGVRCLSRRTSEQRASGTERPPVVGDVLRAKPKRQIRPHTPIHGGSARLHKTDFLLAGCCIEPSGPYGERTFDDLACGT